MQKKKENGNLYSLSELLNEDNGCFVFTFLQSEAFFSNFFKLKLG
jgi:hypothetical protein